MTKLRAFFVVAAVIGVALTSDVARLASAQDGRTDATPVIVTNGRQNPVPVISDSRNPLRVATAPGDSLKVCPVSCGAFQA